MAIIHDTIHIPGGGVYPSYGTLMGTRVSPMSASDETEVSPETQSFIDRHVTPQDRTAYHLKPGSQK